MRPKLFTAGLFAAAALLAGAANAAECTLPPEAEAGRPVAAQCGNCQEMKSAKPSRPVAPNIHDVFGASAASRRDYPKYSEGMLGASAKGVTWTEANLFDYLADPKAFIYKVNGGAVEHNMFYVVKDEQKRRDVIAWLKAVKGKPECN